MFRFTLALVAALTALNLFAADPSTSPLVRPVTVDFSSEKGLHFFEMRTYHAAPGKLDALQNRFRDFTNKLMVKHGMEIVGFWVPVSLDAEPPSTLVCILGFPSKEARDRDWREFSSDIEWTAVKTDSEKNGRLIEKVETVFMTGATCVPTSTNSAPALEISTNSPAPQVP